jgi:exopolysaccharide biosynthesis protein
MKTKFKNKIKFPSLGGVRGGLLFLALAIAGCKSGPGVVDKPAAIQSIQVSPESLTLAVGATQQVTATPVPVHADPAEQPFRWESANTAVATVSTSGEVKAESAGTTEITVRARQHSTVSCTIPVTVTAGGNPDPDPDTPMAQISTITIGSSAYNVETLNFADVAEGVRWHKFNVTGFSGGLTVNAVEVMLSRNSVEVCPASLVTSNVETPVSMYNRYAAAGANPVAAINGDFFLLSSANTTGHPQITNRPYGMEVSNGMMGQTPFQWTNGFVIRDNKAVYGPVAFSGTAKTSGGQTFTLSEVNGYAGEGQLVLFNELSNSYGPSDDAHAWSPYSSTMVSLSQPQGGWRVNSPMTFTVAGVTQNITEKDFNGEGAILVGNTSTGGTPNQTIGIESAIKNAMTVTNQGSYWEVTTTGNDPYVLTSALASGVSAATGATFTFEYQSEPAINNMQVFYGTPGVSAGAATDANLQLANTGINAANESQWRTFTLDLATAIKSYGWGKSGHTFRLDIGTGAGNHVLIRNMRVVAAFSGTDSKTFLSSLSAGQQVSLSMDIKLNGAALPDNRLNVVGYHSVILQNGTSINTWNTAEPRTAVGYSQDGRKVYLLVVDGRQSNYSVGATTGQMADIIKVLGAHTAVNLDGGGSSCMVVNGQVKNTPSDGSPRAVANGIMVTVNQ